MFADGTQKNRVRARRQYRAILPNYYNPGRYGTMAGRVQNWTSRQPARVLPAGLEGIPESPIGPVDPFSQRGAAEINAGRWEVGPDGRLLDNWAPPSPSIAPVMAPGATGIRPTPTPSAPYIPAVGTQPITDPRLLRPHILPTPNAPAVPRPNPRIGTRGTDR